MGIAGGLAQFVGYDALVDSTVGMTHTADHQAMNVSDCRIIQTKLLLIHIMYETVFQTAFIL